MLKVFFIYQFSGAVIYGKKYENAKLAEHGVRISILAYIGLSAIKLFIGYLSNSKAFTAHGLNNSTDIIASLAVLAGLIISWKLADDGHPYGHWRAGFVTIILKVSVYLI